MEVSIVGRFLSMSSKRVDRLYWVLSVIVWCFSTEKSPCEELKTKNSKLFRDIHLKLRKTVFSLKKILFLRLVQ